MTSTRKRGRPPTPQTIEKRRIEEMLTNLKSTNARITAEKRSETQSFLDRSEQWRKSILKDHKHGITTPNDHAYQIASIGDESLEGHETYVREQDEKFRVRAQTYRVAGTNAQIEDKQNIARQAIGSFSDLLSRVRPQGPLSMSDAARRMQKDWRKKGNYGDTPSVRTLIRWIKARS